MSVEIKTTPDLDERLLNSIVSAFKDSVVEYTPRVQNLIRLMNENVYFPLEMWQEVCQYWPGKDVPKFLWDTTSFVRMWSGIHLEKEEKEEEISTIGYLKYKQKTVSVYEDGELLLKYIYEPKGNNHYLSREEHFKNGKLHGKQIDYYYTGIVMAETNIINGEKNCGCVSYNKDGKPFELYALQNDELHHHTKKVEHEHAIVEMLFVTKGDYLYGERFGEWNTTVIDVKIQHGEYFYKKSLIQNFSSDDDDYDLDDD